MLLKRPRATPTPANNPLHKGTTPVVNRPFLDAKLFAEELGVHLPVSYKQGVDTAVSRPPR